MNQIKAFEKKGAMIFQGISKNYKESFILFNTIQMDKLKEMCHKVKEMFAFDMWGYLSNPHFYTEDNPVIDWMAIYMTNLVIYQSFIDTGFSPFISLGYSMGLITAVVCNGAISFEDGLNILNTIHHYKKRHRKMSEDMAVIIGLTEQELMEVIDQNKMKESVWISIVNNHECMTISGLNESVDNIVKVCKNRGVLQATKLNSSIAFHSKYAMDGIEELESLLEQIAIADLENPILSTYTQKLIYDKRDLKQELIINMYSKMNWVRTLKKADHMGIEVFADVSIDGSLTKISRIELDEHEFITLAKLNKKIFKNENHGE